MSTRHQLYKLTEPLQLSTLATGKYHMCRQLFFTETSKIRSVFNKLAVNSCIWIWTRHTSSRLECISILPIGSLATSGEQLSRTKKYRPQAQKYFVHWNHRRSVSNKFAVRNEAEINNRNFIGNLPLQSSCKSKLRQNFKGLSSLTIFGVIYLGFIQIYFLKNLGL